jgi:TRAP-type C4-dicarboxylate transport system permease large subunit
MNRQMRRVQKKAEEKQWKERDQLRAERLAKRQSMLARHKAAKKTRRSDNPRATLQKSKIGRFAGVFALVSTFVILLQTIIPTAGTDQNPTFIFIVQVLYYLLFGYFVYLWLERRNRPNALYWTIGTGLALIVMANAAALFIPGVNPDWRVALLGAVMVGLGAYFARLIYIRAV